MHILFDFDGTLAQSQAVVTEELGLLFDRKGKTRPRQITMEYLYQMPLRQRLSTFYFLWKNKEELTQALALRTADIPATPGIREVLETLQSQGHRLSIVSSNRAENIQAFWSKENYNPFVEILGVRGIRSKTGTLARYMRNYFLSPKEMLYITDDYRDIFACQKLGIPVFAVSWGFSQASLLHSAAPSRLLHSPEQILEALTQMETP